MKKSYTREKRTLCGEGYMEVDLYPITPEEHKYLYFVAITDGGRHAFSTNLDDHNRAVRQYLRNRRAQRQQ